MNATKQVTLWCPSDPDIINGNGIYTSPGPSGMTYTMCLTSYRGINGPYYNPARNMSGAISSSVPASVVANALGVIYHGSSTRIGGDHRRHQQHDDHE